MPILPGSDETLCFRCFDKRLNYSELHYDSWDVAQKKGISQRQVRRNAQNGKLPPHVRGIRRYLWDKTEYDLLQNEGEPIRKTLTSPLQEKARAMCQLNDHSWMQYPDYAGNSCSTENVTTQNGNQIVQVGLVRICSFCGQREVADS
ncbi:helix-turn-helix transcriptional regulator [Chloroflexota bacterium]